MTRPARLSLVAIAAVLAPLLLLPPSQAAHTSAPTIALASALDPSAPYEVQGFFPASQYLEAVAVDPARHRVYAAGNDKLTAYDSATNAVVWRTTVAGEVGIAVDPVSGTVYVTGFLGRVLQVVNPANGAVTQNIEVGVAPSQVAIDPKTHKLYVANGLQSDPFGFYGLGVSEVSQGGNIETNDIPVNAANNDGGLAVAVDSDSQRLYVSHAHTYHLSVINTDTRALVADIDLGPDGWVNGITVDEENGKIWATSGATGKVLVIDQATNVIENRIPAGYSMWGIDINPAQGLVFASDQGCASQPACGKVVIFDAAAQTILNTIPIGAGTAHGLAVDPSADKVYVSDITSNRVVILGVPPLYGPGTIGFAARSYTVNAGSPASITVKRVGDLNLASTVTYSTAPGTAVAGTDYTTTSGTLSFPVGSSTASFTVPTAKHGDPEAMPTVQLTLGTVTGGSLRDPSTATLELRESQPPMMTSGSPPDTAKKGSPYSYSFTAIGDPAATFSQASGTLPPGLTLTSAGLLSGTPTSAGPFTFRVTADNGTAPTSTSATIKLTVKEAPAFTASSPPATGTAGTYQFYNYTATGTPAPTFSLASGALPCGIQLFANGAYGGTPTTPGTYQFQVRAANGASPDAVTATTTVTIAAGTTYPPGAPTITGATAGNQSATISFTAPVCGGGAAIDTYTVTASPGGATASGPAGPLTVNGLTNGTPYTFTVKAHNSVGDSTASAPSSSVTPGTVAPTSLSIGPAITILNGRTTAVASHLTSGGVGLVGRSVALVSRTSPAGSWNPVSTLTTGAGGALSATVKPSVNTQYRFEYGGGAGYTASLSGVQSVAVAPTVSIALKPSKVKKGKKAAVYGVALPIVAGTTITLQEQRKGAWTTVGTAKLAAQKLPDGTTRLGYVFSVKLPKGKHVLRVVSAATTQHAAGTSPSVTLKVTK